MSLHARLAGPGRPNLMFLHGLFGQGRNWRTVAGELEPQATSLLVDLPNHGHSPHSDRFSYVDMADALAEDLWNRLGSAASLTVAGHSMGGKVAMVLALRHPELVRGLVVIDIAPEASSHGYGFAGLVAALRSLDVDRLGSRAEASRLLADRIPDPTVRDFLLQNLRRQRGGRLAWLCNLDLLAEALPVISSWPAEVEGSYPGPVLWLRGEHSEYVRPEHQVRMLELFPRAQLQTIPGAGHWVHSDAPEAVIAALRGFLTTEGLARPLP